jgi:diguanylate cyclase (GGDEF)-like protein
VPNDPGFDADLRTRVAAVLLQHTNRVSSAAARLLPASGPVLDGTTAAERLMRPIVHLVTHGIRDDRLEHAELQGEVYRHLEILGGGADQLVRSLYLVAESAVAEVAADSSLGAASDDWPATTQLVRRASFEVLGALLRNRREPAGADLLDPQTSLLIPAVFELALAKEIDRAARLDRPLAMLLIDVDPLPADAGITARRRVLERLGILVRGYFRQCDWIGRHGDDRVAVLLPETESKKALAVSERLRESIEDRLAFVDHETAARVPVTASIALVRIESAGRLDPDRVTTIAEEALERARGDGGNRVECASASTPIDARAYPSRSS